MDKKRKKYERIAKELDNICDGVENNLGHFANLTSLIKENFKKVSWVGFYFYDAKSNLLKLGPFQGKVACLVIPSNHGVCSDAFYHKKNVIVPNVHDYHNHIACDHRTNSEIVIPFWFGNLQGVLDLDSYSLKTFDSDDEVGLVELLSVLKKHIK